MTRAHAVFPSPVRVGLRDRPLLRGKKIRPGADCGSDHGLLTAKFRFKLKKVGKTTEPFRYDLNQIPYDYTVHSLEERGLATPGEMFRHLSSSLSFIYRLQLPAQCPQASPSDP